MTRADKLKVPEQRLHDPTRQRDGTEILDIDHYAPFLLNAVSSAWGRKTSAIYRRDFGLGLTDWRVLSMLNIEPGITASRICDVIRMDKAAVSRSLKTLLEMEHLRYEQPSGDPRKRVWWLSDLGLKVHAQILDVALGCENELVGGIDPNDLDVFLRVMRQMLTNIDPK
ncbi:winged helix-turn-helix transcriptional regulator [Oceanicola sp. D3]|uniref:MarR family winged helix-turn-helix transcriptional regulator n=1 Tax=Oceanicola sp. D3 TaxID=2587163 RepID=UPI001122C813|nr:MarR family winged helix-turn-helix transcriptional regulator [Oceanicola sp. D3]QDC08146.1 winged helix-turn-helix transcriptional regulator [Oceanicola sp. D3]